MTDWVDVIYARFPASWWSLVHLHPLLIPGNNSLLLESHKWQLPSAFIPQRDVHHIIFRTLEEVNIPYTFSLYYILILVIGELHSRDLCEYRSDLCEYHMNSITKLLVNDPMVQEHEPLARNCCDNSLFLKKC